jgi:hypothetical protein
MNYFIIICIVVSIGQEFMFNEIRKVELMKQQRNEMKDKTEFDSESQFTDEFIKN